MTRPGPLQGLGGAGRNQPQDSGSEDRLYTDKPTYMTIKPELKRLLDEMENTHNAGNPGIFSCAGIELESVNKQLTDTVRAATNLSAIVPLTTIVAAGMGLHTLSEDRLTAIAALELRREDDARALEDALKKSFLALAASRLGSWMGVTIDTGLADSSAPPAGGTPAGGMPGIGLPGANRGGGGGASALASALLDWADRGAVEGGPRLALAAAAAPE